MVFNLWRTWLGSRRSYTYEISPDLVHQTLKHFHKPVDIKLLDILPSMKIRNATLNDAKSIMSIQRKLQLETLDDTSRGFITFAIERKKVEQVLNAPDSIVLVTEENDKVIGFLISYSLAGLADISQDWHKKLMLCLSKQEVGTQNVLYYEYIATLPGYRGVGTGLFNELKKTSSRQKFLSYNR